ncbi:MAG: hypothetical protein M3Y29_06955 [Chloroflexota bacterium]|jgi:hypothetical protein|nr:hypothetical protein [Chloroflexota bacterium]
MERDTSERPLADATGLDRPEDLPAMESGDEESREPEASGGEKTAVEGAAAHAAVQRGFGGQTGVPGGIGSHVPADEDEHMDAGVGEGEESTDPRGY